MPHESDILVQSVERHNVGLRIMFCLEKSSASAETMIDDTAGMHQIEKEKRTRSKIWFACVMNSYF